MKNWLEESDSTIVCYCVDIDKKTIVKAIQEGNDTLLSIQQSTLACTGKNCKTLNPSHECCSKDIKKLIELYSGKSTYEKSCSCCCGH